MTSVAKLLWLLVVGLLAMKIMSAADVDEADADGVSDNVNGIPLSRHRRCFPQTTKTCFFNGKVFGNAKMSDPDRAEIFRQLVCRCDIFVLLEVRDKNNGSQELLRDMVNNTCGPIDMVMGPRVGSSKFNKEQPVFYSKTEVVTVLATHQYEDVNGNFSRPPFGVLYDIIDGNMTVGVQTIHASTTGTELELEALYDAFQDFNTTMLASHGTQDFFLGGDFNCDKPYVYPHEQAVLRISNPDLFWWAIPDGVDTMASSTNRTYDRALVAGDRLNYSCFHGHAGVFKFDEELEFPNGTEPDDISNHYVVDLDCI